MTLMQQVRDDYLSLLDLTRPLEAASRRRLLLLVALPAFIVAAQLVEVALAYVYNPGELYYADQFGGPAELWQRLYRFATLAVQTLWPVTVGVLFLGGILTWTRAQATWIFMAGAFLAGVAILFGSAATVIYTVTEDDELISDISADLWLDVARTFGFLSIGFFFVAYRGLAGLEPEPAPDAGRGKAPPL